MANGKKKQNPKAQRPAKLVYNAPTSGRATIGGLGGSALKNAKGLCDPFSPDARGAKIPDDNGSKSVAISLLGRHTLTADAAGRAASLVNPSLREHSWGPATFTATTVTLASMATATAISDYTAFSTAVDEYRVVSWGVRIYSTDAPLNQAGEIAVITLPEEPPTYSGATVADTGSLFENISRFPVAGANVHWISKPVGVAWKEYRNVNLYPSYESVLLVVRGAAAGQTFTVETFINVEAQPKLASLTAVISTKAADHHPTALAAGVNVHNKHRGAHNAPTKTVSKSDKR